MSSARAELQGQTALAIMTSYLVKLHQIHRLPITFSCNNKGILDGCNNSSQAKLCYHRRANMDLYMEYWHASKGLQIKNTWVKGNQDKGLNWSTTEELASQNLPVEATLNILCDKMASEAQKDGCPCPNAPVLPNERWALYINHPVPRKVTGRMEQAISSCIHRDKCTTYVFKKHNIEEARLDKIET